MDTVNSLVLAVTSLEYMYWVIKKLLLLLLLLLLFCCFCCCCCLLSQAFSSRYFSWTSGDPHRSVVKFHTAVLSVLCVMFQVWLSFVVNLSNVFLLLLYISYFFLPFWWFHVLPVQSYISCSTFVLSFIYFSFPLPFVCNSCVQVPSHLSVCTFSLFFFLLIMISGLFALNSLSVCTPWFHNIVITSYSHTGLCVCVCARARARTIYYYYYYYY